MERAKRNQGYISMARDRERTQDNKVNKDGKKEDKNAKKGAFAK